MQIVDHKEAVYRAIVNRQGESELTEGQVWNKQYRGALYTRAYTRGTDATVQTWTNTNETLTVNVQRETTFYFDDMDKLQSHQDDQREYASDAGRQLQSWIDGDVLGEVANANSQVDAADVSGGTDTNGFTLSTSNVLTALSLAEMRLGIRNINPGLRRVAVVGPHFLRIVREYMAGKDTPLADEVLRNGRVLRALGWDFHLSNNLYWEARLSLVTQPSNSDTLTFNMWDIYSGSVTITLTFVTSIGSTAGNVLIGGNVDVTRANAAGIINTPGTTDANQVALSTVNQYRIEPFTATNDNTADTLLVTAEGVGFVNVGETLTDATDTWTTGREIQHNLFCTPGAIDLIIQMEPSVQVNKAPLRKGSYILSTTLYGLQSFNDQRRRIVDVAVDSSGFSF